MEGVILGVGNPLLDISAPVPKSLLDKYGVELNNAVLAEEKHLPVYEELVREHEVEYIAGGATQNSIRVAQWILQRPGATAYIGCVGKDKFGSQLKSCAEEDGVAVHYLEDAETPTGTCAVLVVNKERSLIANLAAANKYKAEHLSLPEIVPVWTRARIVYISGFFLTVSPPAIMFLAEQCRSMGKTFIMNLAAPFISQFFSEPLLGALPFVDIIIGNESEAKAFGEKMGFPDTSPTAIALKLSEYKRIEGAKPRIAIVTQGAHPTIVACEGKTVSFEVPHVPSEEIVDSNGAGDGPWFLVGLCFDLLAFVGGLLACLALDKSLEDGIHAGHYCASFILRRSGTSLPGKPDYKL